MNNQLNKNILYSIYHYANIHITISNNCVFPNALNNHIISQCFWEFSPSLSVHYQLCVTIWAHNVPKVITAL